MKFSDVDIEAAAERIPRKSVDMTKFWGEGAIVYGRPVTPADHRRVSVKHKNFTTNPTLDGMCMMICLVAQTESGENFFELSDRLKLVKMPVEILTPLFELVGGAIDEDELEKN